LIAIAVFLWRWEREQSVARRGAANNLLRLLDPDGCGSIPDEFIRIIRDPFSACRTRRQPA